MVRSFGKLSFAPLALPRRYPPVWGSIPMPEGCSYSGLGFSSLNLFTAFLKGKKMGQNVSRYKWTSVELLLIVHVEDLANIFITARVYKVCKQNYFGWRKALLSPSVLPGPFDTGKMFWHLQGELPAFGPWWLMCCRDWGLNGDPVQMLCWFRACRPYKMVCKTRAMNAPVSSFAVPRSACSRQAWAAQVPPFLSLPCLLSKVQHLQPLFIWEKD